MKPKYWGAVGSVKYAEQNEQNEQNHKTKPKAPYKSRDKKAGIFYSWGVNTEGDICRKLWLDPVPVLRRLRS